MYLTRFSINRTRRTAREWLGSPYFLHAAVAGSFPGWSADGSQGSRPLWRVDIEPSGPAWLYIVSQVEPSLVGLNEQIGFPDLAPTWRTQPYEPFLDSLAAGQLWSFRLVANPVRGARNQPGNVAEKSKRRGHVTARQQLSWLIGQAAYPDGSPDDSNQRLVPTQESRAARNGFEIPIDESGCPRVIVSDRKTHNLKKPGVKDPITITTARYDGVLRITDAPQLRQALTHGIGHAKAFGCGLLTLAPLKTP